MSGCPKDSFRELAEAGLQKIYPSSSDNLLEQDDIFLL